MCSRETFLGYEDKDTIFFLFNDPVTNPDITALGEDIADNG
jgi:hypothetical protein